MNESSEHNGEPHTSPPEPDLTPSDPASARPDETASAASRSAETNEAASTPIPPTTQDAIDDPPPTATPPTVAEPETEPDMAAIDREVADAMAGMDSADLAELGAGITQADPGLTADSVEPGTELTGTVVGISGDDVFLEFGPKSQGSVPKSQFGKKEVLDRGRRVDVVVERYDAESGLLIVSRKGAVQRATWANLTKGQIVQGRVTGVVKGGLEMSLSGIRAFMPASQVDIAPMKDVSVLLNESLEVEIIEFDRRAKNVLVSRRRLLEKQRTEAKEKLKAELEVGQVRQGVVKSIMDYGAFVDIGGIDGLVHIRELSWGTVDKVSDVLTEGQKIEVKVLKIDEDRERVSLGLRQTQPDPWTDVSERFAMGAKVKARVMRIVNFGAFLEVVPGVEGLLPVSEMAWGRVNNPSDVVSVGDVVDAVVIRLEPKRRRMALSLKQAQPDPWEGVLAGFTEQSLVKGKVTRLVDFGVFVELTPGVEGLIHISELSDRRVKSCGEVVKEGEEIEARVLGIDKDNRRISLSIRAVASPAADAVPASVEEAPKPKKKRKKPLRGGLDAHFDW